VRQRKEQEAAFRHDGEREMATREAQEILILQEFLPPALGSEELEQLVTAGIAAVGAANPRDTHRVMLRLTPALRGRADLRAVTALINRRLAPLRPGQESPSLDRGAPSPA